MTRDPRRGAERVPRRREFVEDVDRRAEPQPLHHQLPRERRVGAADADRAEQRAQMRMADDVRADPFPEQHQRREAPLVARGDEALYQSKQQGRNRVTQLGKPQANNLVPLNRKA